MIRKPTIWIGGGLVVVLGAVSAGLLVAREARDASSGPGGGSDRSTGEPIGVAEAKRLGISYKTMRYRARKFGLIDPDSTD